MKYFTLHSLPGFHRGTLLQILGFSFLLSCSPTVSTQITGSWKEPTAHSYKDFFVIVISKNLEARRTIENDLSYRLKKAGAKASPSLVVLPHAAKPETPEERQAAVEKIQGLGHEAILTVSLVKKEEDAHYVPGQTQYTPTSIGYGSGYSYQDNLVNNGTAGVGYYGSFGSYYTVNSSMKTTDSYYEMDKTYFMETNLYDSKSAKLVWSAQSETFNPMNIDMASSGFSLVVVEALKKAGFIVKQE